MATKTPVKQVEVALEFERETTNKVRFAEVGSEHVGTQYLRKESWETLGSPQALKLVIQAA